MTLPIACFDRQLVRDTVNPCSSKARVEPSLFADTVASDYEK